MVAHGRGDGGDRAFVEARTGHMATPAIGLNQVEELDHGLGRIGRMAFQLLFGIEGSQLWQRQIGQQNATQQRGMGGQPRAHAHRTGQRCRRCDLGHIDNGAAVAHHDVAGEADFLAQARNHGLAQLGQIHGGQELEAQAQH
ncbi:hypothetical protein SDC9_144549 [bioreactor metagenome]|uniref:Uncharacterized protein n=1 Tax=bioreactor metagenome TaxID=1076179 RepID=A0A645E727_9ZZZZ